MGYNASGTVNIVFANKAMEEKAAAALLSAGIARGWKPHATNPNPSFYDFFSDEWDAMKPTVADDGTISYEGYVMEKWRDQEEFGRAIAPFVQDLDGDFTGEDDSQWGWRLLPDGTFDEFSYVPVPDYVHSEFERDAEAIKAILQAVESGDDAAILRAAKIATVPYMGADQLSKYADDADDAVKAKVTEKIMSSL